MQFRRPVVRRGGRRFDQQVRPQCLIGIGWQAGVGGEPRRPERQVALRVGRQRAQLDAEHVDAEHVDPVGVTLLEVGLGEQSVAAVDQSLPEGAPVERVATAPGDRLQRQGNARPADERPRSVGLVGELVQLALAGIVEERDHQGEQRAGREATGGETDRRGEDDVEVEQPEAVVEGDPSVDATGDRHAAQIATERHHREAFGAQRRGVGARTGAPAGVEPDEVAAGRRHDGEEITTHSAQVRSGDGDRGVGGDRRVDGVAASGEREHPRLGGQLVGGDDDRTAAADHVERDLAGGHRRLTVIPAPDYSCQVPRSTSTSRSTPGRSVMIPSTPRSRSRCISAASSIVHTWTAMPRRWQRRTKAPSTTVTGPRRTGTWAARAPVDQPGELQHGQLPLAGGRAQPSSQHPAQGANPSIAERREAHTIEGVVAVDRLDQWPSAVLALAVDVEAGLRPGVEQLVERRDRFRAVHAGVGNLGEAQLGNPSRPTAQSRQVLVVEDDDDPVGRDANVGLEVAVAERDRVGERPHRVLRGVAGAAAMGEGDRTRPFQVRMAGGHAGSMVARMSSEEIVVNSPFDGTEIGRVPQSTTDDVNEAVATAQAAFRAGALPRWKRAEILDAAARLLGEREEEFARTIAAEAAKPIRTARVEAQRAVGTFQFAAAEARTFAGEIVPLDAIAAGEGKVGLAMRVPIGVVGAISPFNFPLNLVAHKLAPAIAAGCPVVLKPASQTPLSAIALARLLVDECGLPAGVPPRRHRRRQHRRQRHRRTP